MRQILSQLADTCSNFCIFAHGSFWTDKNLINNNEPHFDKRMEDINEQLNQLHKKISAVDNIVALKNMRRDFVSTCFAFADVHKKLERGYEFEWYKRFTPVINVLDGELESGNFESAKSSMTSNIEAMQTFKKSPNDLMSYQSIKNKNNLVDRKEKIEYIRMNSKIEGFRMSGVNYVYSQVAELNSILCGLYPPENNKDAYDYIRKSIEYSLEKLLECSAKWSSAIRPTESTQRDWVTIKKKLQVDIQKCITLLEISI